MRLAPALLLVVALLGASCQASSPPPPSAGPTTSAGGAAGSATIEPGASPSPNAASSTSPLPSAAPVKLLVDTDVAPDDLVAISFLVAAPNVELAAITVSGTGEVHCPRGVDVVLGLLERLDARQIPVACGDDRPIALDHAFPDLFRSNADDAAGLDLPPTTRKPAGNHAADVIASLAQAERKGLRVLTLGPLTDLAQAVAKRNFSDGIEAVYVMGGAVDVPGNIAGSPGGPQDNTTAEWNAYVDPAALATVLDAGLTVRLVGLDGTNQVPLTTTFADRVAAAATRPPLGVLAELLRKNDYMRSGGYYLWDTVAAVAAAGFPVADFTDAHLSVDTGDGPTSGATRRAEGPVNAAYMTRADASAIEALIISVMDGG
jgi:inosine-uridine nucleoside N-ribohydrolase